MQIDNNGMHQALQQCEQILQQLVNQTEQASQNYQMLLQQELQNAQQLHELAQREQRAAQIIQNALQGHHTAVQQLQHVSQICRQLEQTAQNQQAFQPVYDQQNGMYSSANPGMPNRPYQ